METSCGSSNSKDKLSNTEQLLTDYFAKLAEIFITRWVLSDIEANLHVDPNQF